jgi:putative ABC transport system permease protein
VQGVLIETEVSSLRRVDWARFDTNFFVVFETGVLERAPHTYVALLNAPSALLRAELQRDLVRRHSNLSAVDVTLLLTTLDRIIGSVAAAIRFMAVFTLAAGFLVLLGAIATSRLQRLRESVLLKTLGAAGPELRVILATEYGVLGALAGLTGTLLAGIAGWASVRFLFELTFRFPAAPLAGFAAGSVLVTLVVGLLSSRDVFRRPPLAVLREMGE